MNDSRDESGSRPPVSAPATPDDALLRTEQRYRALIEATSQAVWVWRPGDNTRDFDEARLWWESLTGQSLTGQSLAEQQADDAWLQVVHPEDRAAAAGDWSQAVATGTKYDSEYRVHGRAGDWLHVRARGVPIPESDGSVREWVGTLEDVTRRKQAEEELQDIRSRMETALEAGAIGTWSWDVQADRCYGDASLARIFSITAADVAGGPISGLLDAVHPNDRAQVRELIEQALVTGNRYESDYRITQPDGSWKWVPARGQVERDAAGKPVRFPGVVIDITDRKRAEEHLARVTHESERRKRLYETILSNTPDFAYVFDLEHHFVYVNENLLRMWGKTAEEAFGKTCLELGYEPWHASLHDREIEEVKMTRKPIRGEVPFHGTFGRRIYDYIFVPVFGIDGEVEAVAGTTRDVTDRKAAEEALRDADRKKDDFLALLAHELRNPLAPIRNGLQVMRLAEGDPSMIAEARDMMDRQLSHMVRLIDDLLDISRITRNKMDLRRSRVTLADVVANAVEASGPIVRESGHELTVVLPPTPVLLDADLTRLAQVFSNLLTNSAKYTPAGGKIWLTGERLGDEAIVSVRDTGIGIPAAALPKIFDMFSQVDRSVERSTGGLGIGLALVKGLVEMHGGTVAAESIEGKGSTFTVRLPIIEPTSMLGAAKGGGAATRGARRRVLVVDDNRDGADSMAMMLRLLGNEVATAHDGIDAVSVAGAFRPEIILMDIGLPRLNGLDATRQIRNQTWGTNTTIIALTGWGQESDRDQSRAAGCDGHLVKPVQVSDLEAVLRMTRRGV